MCRFASISLFGPCAILFTALISDAPKIVTGKFVSKHLQTHETWTFLERFCFLSYDGSFEYEIEYDSKYGNISLLMYPDLQWPLAYHNPKADTCEKKLAALLPDKYQVVKLVQGVDDSGCERVHNPKYRSPMENNGTQSFTTKVMCRNKRRFRSARERWWFISISSCNNTKGLNLKYKFWMKNGPPLDYWYEHFSADEFYILPILTAFCFVYLFLLFCALIFAVELKCRQLFHTTYKLFLVSLAFQTIGIMLLCIAYGNYASNGVGLPVVKLIGRILEGGSEFVFVLLLLLLAKGYTVTRGRLRPATAVKLTIFNCAYLLTYSLLFVIEQYNFDDGLVLYIYESPAGYGILVLRMIGYLMFVYGIFFTLKHYPEKSTFYIPFFGVFSLWFVSGPIMIIISNYVIDKWVREKVAISTQHVCAFIGHVVFLGLTRPSAANKSFPYHVRTTQVGMAEDKPLGPGGTDHFESHSYAPSYIDPNGRTVDIFTVTGVVQRGSGANGGPNLDVFSANGGIQPCLPAMFPLPPPKYTDAFPHEKPGEIVEMLKELGDSDPGTDSAEEDSGSGGAGAAYRRPLTPPPVTTRGNRESIYRCE